MIIPQPLGNKEARVFWEGKVPLTAAQFRKLGEGAKIHAFAVSGIAKGDLLTTVQTAIYGAIKEGKSLGDFKKEIRGVIEQKGWIGKRAWRVDNIYRTNVQTAYSVGRYQQMIETTKTRPYWRYSAVNDSGTRPTHLAQDGKVYPANHVYWDIWYPLNGYGCRCKVTSLSQRDLDRLGLKVETQDPTNRLIEPVDVKGNKLPARTMIPDRGFAHNPGKIVYGGIVDESTKPGAWQTLSGVNPAKTALTIPGKPPVFAQSPLPQGLTDADYIDRFEELHGKEQVITDPLGDPVVLSLRAYMDNKTPGNETWAFAKHGQGQSIPVTQSMIEQPVEVWLVPEVDPSDKVRLTKRYVSAWQQGGEDSTQLAAFDVVDGVWQGIKATTLADDTAATLSAVEGQRQGIRIYKRAAGK